MRGLCDQFGVERLEAVASAASRKGLDPAESDLDSLAECVPLEPDLLDAVKSSGSAGASPSLDLLMTPL